MPVSVLTGKDGNRLLQVGRHKLPLEIALPEGPIRTRDINQASDRSLSIVEVGKPGESVAVVLTRGKQGPTVLWSGDLRLRGDLGERHADLLSVEPDNASGENVFVGKTHERARLCGVTALPVFQRERVDATGLTAAPVSFAPTGEALSTSVSVEAGDSSTWSHPQPHLLVARGSSTDALSPMADPPHTLVDGNGATGWNTVDSAAATEQFVSFGWSGGDFAITRLGITFGEHPPQALRVLAEGSYANVEVPSSYQPGQRLLITLAKPVSGHCLSLQITRADQAQTPITIQEVEAFSTLDSAGGIAALLAALDGPHSSDASRILTQSDARVVKPLLEAWPKLSPAARQKGLPTLLKHLTLPPVRATLELILAGGASELASATTEALLSDRRPEAWSMVIGRLSGEQPDGHLAILAARSGRAELVQPVLKALATAREEATQAQLQEAFGLLCRRAPEAVQTAVPAWLAEGPPGIAAARAARELSSAELLPDQVAKLSAQARQAATGSDDFVARWWAVAASAADNAEPEGDSYLEKVATDAKEWMLRDAALASLASRQSDRVTSVAKAALVDEYPRVRSRALRILAERGQELAALVPHLTRDRWHLVRATAAEALPDSPEVRAGLVKAVDDRVDTVQVAAIERATALKLKEAWKPVKGRLEDQRESLPVKLKAIDYASSLCIEEAADILRPWAQEGLGPKATESGHVLAIASIEALATLGATEGIQGRIKMVTDPGLRTAAKEALETKNHCASPATP